MENIEFRCMSCGIKVEKDLLPGKHTILGSLPIVNKEADCCEHPDYEDGKGFHRARLHSFSFREMVPGIA